MKPSNRKGQTVNASIKPTLRAALCVALPCVLLSLTACGLTREPLIQTRTIEVPGPTRYVALDSSLTAPIWAPVIRAGVLFCPDLDGIIQDYAAALKRANADRKTIRSLQSKPAGATDPKAAPKP